ncbi:hypothetical protein ACIRJO_02705 [Streptomyces sp. NPDC102394]|uniref:hypothetical protein n=1 Tax=Streptomyces sp. NPDC102394 TaxID=3366167 RepID=UPI003805C34C
MNLLSAITLAAALLAVLLFLLGAGDGWFFSLLSLACLLHGAHEAYLEHHPATLGCLIAGAFFAGAAFRSLFTHRTTPDSNT